MFVTEAEHSAIVYRTLFWFSYFYFVIFVLPALHSVGLYLIQGPLSCAHPAATASLAN